MSNAPSRRAARNGLGTSRQRILDAARANLGDTSPDVVFTLDGVAQRAGVSRMTVYYQFRSSAGLIDSLYQELARESLAPALQRAMAAVEPRERLEAIVGAFASFWHAERLVLRRVHALSVLDAALSATQRARDDSRRAQLRGILAELGGRKLPGSERERLVDLLATLTSFHVTDSLLDAGQSIDSVTGFLVDTSRTTLGELMLRGT